MTDAPSFEVRDLSFELGSGIPRYWHARGRAVTLYLNALSLFFPHGERFFVASVRGLRSEVKDPQLLEEVRVFSGQEGVHSREHRAYNRMLEAQGFAAANMERRVERLLALVTRLTTARLRLAITSCLEHFTAFLARSALSHPEQFAGAHPTMAALWRWHAAEESEHKAVAFDVYRTAGGYYVERVVVMLVTTLIFNGLVLEFVCRLMWADGIFWSIREWATLVRFEFFSPWSCQQLRDYLAWYRPRFHPNDVDDRALLQRWQAKGLSEGQPSFRAALAGWPATPSP